MCDELLRCFRRRSAKVESFWPGAEPASLPRGCSLIQTCCMHPHARRTHILSHALKHPSPTPSHASSSDHLVFQATYCTSSCELISCAEPLPPFLLILRRRLLGLWEVGRDRLPFLRTWPALLYISLIVNKSHEKMTPRNWLLSYKYFGWLGFVAVHMAAKYLLRIYGFVATNIYKKSWLLIKNIWFCHHKHVCKKSWLLINIIQFCHYKPDCRTSWLLTKIIHFCCHKHNSKISWLLV